MKKWAKVDSTNQITWPPFQTHSGISHYIEIGGILQKFHFTVILAVRILDANKVLYVKCNCTIWKQKTGLGHCIRFLRLYYKVPKTEYLKLRKNVLSHSSRSHTVQNPGAIRPCSRSQERMLLWLFLASGVVNS